jgi:hypothetical protein
MLGIDLEDMAFDADCARAFTLHDGSEYYGFRTFYLGKGEETNGHAHSNADFGTLDAGDQDFCYEHDTREQRRQDRPRGHGGV